jgi:hypothetical protein
MNTPTNSEALPLTNCSVLLDLAIQWNAQAEIHDAAGNADCGTGSDVPYAMASILREHAAEIEKLAYIFSRQNDKDQARRAQDSE